MFKRLPVFLILILAATSWSVISAQEDTSHAAREDSQVETVVYEHEIDATVADVWEAFTTNDGLVSWMAPIVEIDLRIGGKMVSNYNKDGELGDATTIENTILCYEPERMLSLQATKFPEGFPFKEAAQGTWSIFYFTPISPTQTQIRVVGLGYRNDGQSKQMRSFFAGANKQSLDQLNEALRNKRQADESK